MNNNNILVFNVQPRTLKRVIDTVEKYGNAILHGDGMIYTNNNENSKTGIIQPSVFHKDFSNHASASYTLYFDKLNINTIPQTGDASKDIEAIVQMFLKHKAIEIASAQQAAEPTPIYTIRDEDAIITQPTKTRRDIEIENAALRDEVSKLKKTEAPQKEIKK